MTADLKISKLIVKRPSGFLEAEPDTPSTDLTFHPIPKPMVESVKEGDIWEGHYGRLWDTGKKDVTNRRIFIRYFIPETLIKSGGSDV
jgi:hypothetical protein